LRELTIHGDELEKAISLEFVDDDDITFYVKLASSRRRHKQNETQAKSHPLNFDEVRLAYDSKTIWRAYNNQL